MKVDSVLGLLTVKEFDKHIDMKSLLTLFLAYLRQICWKQNPNRAGTVGKVASWDTHNLNAWDWILFTLLIQPLANAQFGSQQMMTWVLGTRLLTWKARIEL